MNFVFKGLTFEPENDLWLYNYLEDQTYCLVFAMSPPFYRILLVILCLAYSILTSEMLFANFLRLLCAMYV
jgi:hypothetical protein